MSLPCSSVAPNKASPIAESSGEIAVLDMKKSCSIRAEEKNNVPLAVNVVAPSP